MIHQILSEQYVRQRPRFFFSLGKFSISLLKGTVTCRLLQADDLLGNRHILRHHKIQKGGRPVSYTHLESHRMEVSAISHEIRNPFTLIYSTLQMIEGERLDVTACTHWQTLRRDMEYMKQLLEELSSYNNGDHLKLAPMDTNTFLKTLALSLIHIYMCIRDSSPPAR